MRRRDAISVLLGSAMPAAANANARLARILDPGRGAIVVLETRERRLLATNGGPAGSALAPPGSTIKPIVLAALLRQGKLWPGASHPCPQQLSLLHRHFDCMHPPMHSPMKVDTAIAYSCNNFVARFAELYAPGELGRILSAAGLSSITGLAGQSEVAGRVGVITNLEAQRVQALGETGVEVTPLSLALAYRQLALSVGATETALVLEGLEGAVEYGTAQRAKVLGTSVAGKTGSTRNGRGEYLAWFAGFMPSRSPEVVVTVMTYGKSGGADAAPLASQVLQAYKERRL